MAVQLFGELVDSPPDGRVSLGSQALVSAESRMPSYQIPTDHVMRAERVVLSAVRAGGDKVRSSTIRISMEELAHARDTPTS